MNRFYQMATQLLAITTTTAAVASDFAIRTRIYDGEKLEQQTLTVFEGDTIFDILIKNGEPDERISVFETKTQLYRVLQLNEEKQLVVRSKQLEQLVANHVVKAKQQNVPFIRFAADPQFKKTLRESEIQLKSPIWSYDVQGTKANPETIRQYREFADAFAKLNTLFSPVPPNARLRLNASLFEQEWIPQQVKLHIYDKSKDFDYQRTVKHEYNWTLTNKQKSIVQQAKHSIENFPWTKNLGPRVALKAPKG